MNSEIKIKIYAVKLKYNKFIHFFDNENQAKRYNKNVDDESILKEFNNSVDFWAYILENKNGFLYNFEGINFTHLLS